MTDNIIGIIGGMGPYAGLDLVQKIFDETQARTDQDHLPVALLSYPGRIQDRNAFLLGQSPDNPANAIAGIAGKLEDAGARVAGMPCNSAHVPEIFDYVLNRLRSEGRHIRLLHMIQETVRHVSHSPELYRRIGVLSTLATFRFKLYQRTLEEAGLPTVLPDEAVQEHIVQPAISDTEYGIKAQSNPVSERARRAVLDAITHLRNKGADTIILGCTELPLAVPEGIVESTRIIDPTRVLARALIRETYPGRLKQ